MDAGLGDLLFWGALVRSLALAFVVTVPVNRGSSHGARATPWSTSSTSRAATTTRHAGPRPDRSTGMPATGQRTTRASTGDERRARRPGGRQSANLARHLNGQHPSTVLLLARHAPGGTARRDRRRADRRRRRPDADRDDARRADVALRLALPEGPDVRARIGALLAATRAGLPDTVAAHVARAQMAGGGRGPHGSAAHG